jgi:ribosomal-protein-alanine N-acetyltransferase
MHPAFEQFPVIDCRSFVLREIVPRQDAESFYRYMTHPDVAQFISEEELPISLESSYTELTFWSQLFYRRLSIYWAIADKETNRMIGTCGFNIWTQVHHRVEISYDLSVEYWRKGIMTEALAQINRFAFKKMDVTRIQAFVVEHNVASIGLLEKLGFTKEAVAKRYHYLQGKSRDSYLYALTP